MSNEIIIENKPEQQPIQLYLTHSSFAEIILNFLGNKQSLNYELFDQNFKLEKNDLEQFYYLLEDKLAKENTTQISHFNCIIHYFDDTSREINSIKALTEFYETRNVLVKSVSLKWNIILNFPNAQSVENQVIELTFDTYDKNFSNGDIYLNIQHTNQSWGIEVLNLFKDHISNLIISKTKIEKIFNFISNVISFRNMPIFAMVIMIFVVSNSIFKLEEKKNTSEFQIDSLKIISEQSNDNIDNKERIERLLSFYIITNKIKLDDYSSFIESPKINTILLNFNKDLENKTSSYLISTLIFIFLFIAILISIKIYVVYALNYYSQKAYILLSKQTENHYNNFVSKKSTYSFYSFTLILISVITSLIASFVYKFLF